MSGNVLDEENWRLEAQAVINDIKDHVADATVSDEFASSNKRIYVKVRTLEGQDFCVELSARGFRLCGTAPDEADVERDEYYETPYGLLNKISPKFRESFGNDLVAKLNALRNEQQ